MMGALVMFANKIRSRCFDYLVLIVFLFLSIWSCWIFGKQGRFYSANDLKFHLARITELVNDLRFHNSLLNPLNFASFKNTGVAVQAFYPSLTLWPFALLQIIFKQPIFALYTTIVIYSFLGCWLSYFLLLRFTDNDQLQSALFAVIYNFSIYHVTDLFIRFDLGEWLAMLFLPLIFYGGYQVLKGWPSEWKFGTIGLTLVGYSHVLTLALSLLFLGGSWLIGWLILRPRDFATRLTAAGKLILSTLMLLLFELYPLVKLTLFNNIHFPAKYNLVRSPTGKLPSLGNFLRLAFNDQLTKNLGLLLPLILIGCLLLWRKMPLFYRWSWILLVLLVACTTTFFPWAYLQRTPIAIIQFPWRLLTIASLFMALNGSWLIAALFRSIVYRWKIKGKLIWSCLLLLLVVFPTLSAEKSQLYQDKKSDQLADLNKKALGRHYWINDQLYSKFVKASDNTDYYPEHAFIANKSILQQKVLTASGSFKLPLTKYHNNQLITKINSTHLQKVNLPWLKYQGIKYQLFVNHQRQQFKASDRSTFQIRLKRGENKISLKSKSLTGQFMSEVAALFSGIYLLL